MICDASHIVCIVQWKHVHGPRCELMYVAAALGIKVGRTK